MIPRVLAAVARIPAVYWGGLAIALVALVLLFLFLRSVRIRESGRTEYELARRIAYTVREVRAGDPEEELEPFRHPVELG